MKRPSKQRIKTHLADILELPSEIMLDLPQITLIGRRQLYLENHKGIIEYTPEKIRVNTSQGTATILGREMVLQEHGRRGASW